MVTVIDDFPNATSESEKPFIAVLYIHRIKVDFPLPELPIIKFIPGVNSRSQSLIIPTLLSCTFICTLLACF